MGQARQQRRCAVVPRRLTPARLQFKAGTTALFDMLAQHPDVLLPRKTEDLKWHEMCPLNKPACVIKEVNGARARLRPHVHSC